MDQTNDEPNRDGLGNLPESERKETQSILDEINAGTEKKAPEGEKPADKEPKEKPAEGEKKPELGADGKPKAEGKEPKEEKRRDFKMVPAYVLSKTQKEHEKAIADLKAELDQARSKPTQEKKEDAEDGKGTELPAKLEAKAKEIAEKRGIDIADARDIVSEAAEAVAPAEIPGDIREFMDTYKKDQDEKAIQTELAKFTEDFTVKIIPLIRAEYGADVPQSTIDAVREKIREAAYTNPEYEKTPFSVIYKGDDSFRDLVAQKKKGGEGGRGGYVSKHEATRTDGPDISKPMTESDVKNLSPEDFDKWSDNMAALERSKK